jgi:hypothetical protein
VTSLLNLRRTKCAHSQAGLAKWFCLVVFACAFSVPTFAQDTDYIKPVPVLSGSAGFITTVDGGHPELAPIFAPVVLVPVGDRWLIESRAEFKGEFENRNGSFGGPVEKQLDYLQVDYIANPYVTLTAGRFLTPFGLYNERLYPIWIRNLQNTPLIFPIGTGASDGAMLRGGFQAHPGLNVNYAAYFSTLSTVNKFESDRMLGGRFGIFLPGPRLELGVSLQHMLQEERANAFGFHFEWQPRAMPLDLRAEYSRSPLGSGYWAESAYRLSELPIWQGALRHVQLVARAQQFFVGRESDEAEEYGVPETGTKQAEVGFNYFLMDGLKTVSSYGRQFSAAGNANIWTVGIAYRFAMPLGSSR